MTNAMLAFLVIEVVLVSLVYLGGLAHLGERLICIQEVAGSIPVSSTRKHLVIKTVNKNNLYQYLYPNIKSYYLMFKIKI